NRLYTASELRDLLRGNGFQPTFERGLTEPHRRSWYQLGMLGQAKWIAMLSLQRALLSSEQRRLRWCDDLLFFATKFAAPVSYRPSWLFGAADGIPMVAHAASNGAALSADEGTDEGAVE